MTLGTQAGRFWRGTWLGVAMGLVLVLGFGWWLSESPASPSAAPPPAATPAEPSSPTAPGPVPQFAPAPQRVAAEKTATPPAATAAAESVEASQQADRGAAQTVDSADDTEAAAETLAARAVGQAPEDLPEPVAEEAPLEDALRLRDRFDSLSEAMLGEGSGDAPPGTELTARRGAVDDGSVPSGQWIDVWQPFTSPVSARGFADRLELLTGFTYRVERRAGDGLHQVAVLPLPGYAPQQMLQQIADRSGLAMVSP